MDSLTQAALGAAVGYGVLGRHAGRKALVWGAVLGTLPDLDVFVPLGDDVADFTHHRGPTHSLLLHAAATPAISWVMGRVQPAILPFRLRRWLLAFLCLATHALLDGFTAYSTQLLWPLPVAPTAWSTLFILDPLYSLPLLAGVIAAIASGGERGARWNRMGLLLSSGYLLLSIAAKLHVDGAVRETLRGDPEAGAFTSGATPFNILLWRVVAMDSDGYRIGYYSLLDDSERVRFTRYPDDRRLLEAMAEEEPVADLKRVTKGFYGVRLIGSEIQMADLRMGFEPAYVFRFVVGELRDGRVKAVPNRRVGGGPDVMTLGWIWRRIRDESLPPPHPGEERSSSLFITGRKG